MKYNQKLVKELCELIETGKYSVAEACRQVGISKMTYYRWKQSKRSFAAAIDQAETLRKESQREMAMVGLSKLLTGFEYDEVSVVHKNNRQGEPVIASQRIVRKLMMPNVTAIIFTLTNLDKENWKHIRHADVTSKGDKLHDGNTFLKYLIEAGQVKDGESDTKKAD